MHVICRATTDDNGQQRTTMDDNERQRTTSSVVAQRLTYDAGFESDGNARERRSRSFYPRDVVSKLRQRGWLDGWLSVCHSRYYIKTTKPVLKLFQPSDSPVIEAFGTRYVDTKFQGEPLHRGLYIHGIGKIDDFRRKWPVSRKRCEIGR